MTATGDPGTALARLPPHARERLDILAKALDRIDEDDLSLHVARRRQPRHRRAVETAELVAIESGLVEPLDAARQAMIQGLTRRFIQHEVRVVGFALTQKVTPMADQVRIAESVADAVTAIVLAEDLDADTYYELLGLWDRLLP